jgi:hypothetical protein
MLKSGGLQATVQRSTISTYIGPARVRLNPTRAAFHYDAGSQWRRNPVASRAAFHHTKSNSPPVQWGLQPTHAACPPGHKAQLARAELTADAARSVASTTYSPIHVAQKPPVQHSTIDRARA